MRVATLVDYLSTLGGAERIALSLATHLDRSRFESIMCVSRWPLPGGLASDPGADQALEALGQAGVELVALKRQRKLELAPWRLLYRELRRRRVDILHAHKFGSNFWGVMVGRLARVPVVVAHEHSWSYEGDQLRCLLDRELIARGADSMVAVSRADRARMIAVERIKENRITLIPTGIDVDDVPPVTPERKASCREQLGIGPGAKVLGAVGLLRSEKGHAMLLEAMPFLLAECPSLLVVVVGDGPERQRLEQRARELGVTGSLRILGLRPDARALLAAFDVAVNPSRSEGSPLSVLELMCAGVPLVATAVGGVPDIVRDGIDGLLVKPSDPAALAAAVLKLIRDPDLANRLAASARDRVRSKYSLQRVVADVERLYLRLLDERIREPLSGETG